MGSSHGFSARLWSISALFFLALNPTPTHAQNAEAGAEEGPDGADGPHSANDDSPAGTPSPSDTPLPPALQPFNPFAEEEAPPAVFDLEIGNAEVDLFLLGSWEVTSQVATGVAIHPPDESTGSRFTFPADFPGFESELFAQSVDLTLSLWLYEQYFFEASFVDESDLNTIAAGYIGEEDELVQEVVVGNAPLTVRPYAYQYAGSPGARAGTTPVPGAAARLQTAQTFHELLVQLESSSEQTLRVVGGSVVGEQRIGAHRRLRRRAYVLPDQEVSNVRVYVADEDGDLLSISGRRRFRRLSEASGEYVIDREAGTIRVSAEIAATEAETAIYYETAGGPVGRAGGGNAVVPIDPVTLNPTLGPLLDFDFSDVNPLYPGGPAPADFALTLADGREVLVLHGAAAWSPFEQANLYAVPEGSARIQLVRAGTRTPIEDEARYAIREIAGTGLVQITEAGTQPPDTTWRYPFADRRPRIANAALYGPTANRDASPADVELLVTSSEETEEIVIEGDVVPGTVEITSNGRTVGEAEFDPQSGRVSLPETVSENATVDIRYRTYGSAPGNDLVAISGNRWEVRPDISLALAAGLRWTVPTVDFSSRANEHPGQVTISVSADHAGDHLELSGAVGTQITQADTTGLLRLFGAAESDLTIDPGAETLFPAAPTETDRPDHRARTLYRDYWSVDVLGNVALRGYTAVEPADEDRLDARVGPYVANSFDTGFEGQVAVVEWSSIPPSGWTGAHIRTAGGETDLSDAQSVRVRYRILPAVGEREPPGGGAPRLAVSIGSLDEDLDADQRLDVGASPVDPLIPFDTPRGPRRAGQDAPGLSQALSEDADGDGVLDPPAAAASVETVVEDPLAASAWRTLEFDLSPDQRAQLAATDGARVVIRNASESEPLTAGRLLIGAVEVRRSGLGTVTAAGGGGATVATVEDPLDAPGTTSLREAYSIVGERLAKDRDGQRVVEFSWSDALDAVAAEFAIAELPPTAYETFGVFVYFDADAEPAADGVAPAVLEVELQPYRGADDDQTLLTTVPVSALEEGWTYLTIDTDSGRARSDGRRVDTGETSAPESADRLRVATVRVRGLSAGRLYLDELHAADPRSTLGAGGRVRAAWNREIKAGPLAGARIELTQSADLQGDGFAPASAAETEATPRAAGATLLSRSRAVLSADRYEAGVTTSASVTRAGGSTALGHFYRTPPAPGASLALDEEFYRDFDDRRPLVTRSTALVTETDRLTLRLENDDSADRREIDQRWSLTAQLRASPSAGGSISLDADILSPDESLPSGSYGESWLESYRRVAPLTTNARQERDTDGTLGVEIEGWRGELGGGWTHRGGAGHDHVSRASVLSELSLEPELGGARPLRVGGSYRRDWSLQSRARAVSPAADAALWASDVAAQPVVFTTVPIVELFQPPPALGLSRLKTVEELRTYTAEAELRFERGVGTQVRDLVLPSGLVLSLARNRSREADSRADERRWRAELGTAAINLFGTDAARPRTSLYAGDEFRTDLSVELVEPVDTDSLRRAVAFEITGLFIGERTDELEVRLGTEISDADSGALAEIEANYGRRRPGYPRLAVFERMAAEPYYRHGESLEVEVRTTEWAFETADIMLGHETALVLGEHGEIAVFGDLGWRLDTAGYRNALLHLIGIQLGINGTLRY